METLDNWKLLFWDSLRSLLRGFMASLPAILGALILLLIGWLLARGARFLIRKILLKFNFNSLVSRSGLGIILDRSKGEQNPTEIAGNLVFWVVNLLFLVAALETVGLHEVSQEIRAWIAYLPKFLSALFIFAIGFYFSQLVRGLIQGATVSLGMSGGRVMAKLIFYLLVIIVGLTSLEQAGIDTSIVTSNLTLILGAVLISAGISYGFASRDILHNILSGFFGKRIFREGQTIELEDGLRGKVIELGSTHARILTSDGHEVVIPQSQLLNTRVKVLN